jgi:hypothetical protein
MSFPQRTAFLVLAILILAQTTALASPSRWGDVTGPLTASSLGVRVPRTLQEVATLTTADYARMNAAIARRQVEIRRLAADGALPVSSVVTTPTGSRRMAGSLASVNASHLYSSASCGVFWTDFPGSGTDVWGGGWTRSNASAILQALGNFYKQGNYVSGWGNSGYVGTNAEGYSTHVWRYWWESTYSFFTEGDHWIKNGDGSYDWGPWHCTAQAFK